MLYILDRNEEIVGLLQSNSDRSKNIYYDDILTEMLSNGADTFTFTSIADKDTNEKLIVGNYIAFKKNNKFKLLQIIEVNENKENILTKEVYCEGAGLELINTVYSGSKMSSVNVERFLKNILQDTNWQVGHVSSNLTKTLSLDVEEKEVYSIIQEYLYDFEAEIDFRVEIKGNRVVGRYIDVYSKKGRNNGKRLEINRDIKGISRKISLINYATKLIGEGKNGLNFRDISMEGEINKPLGQNFVINEDAYSRINNNGKHITRKFTYDTEDAYELLRQTHKALKEYSEPKITYEVDVDILDFNDIEIGDYVSISDLSFTPPLLVTARISELATSKTNKYSNKAVLSNFNEVRSGISSIFPIPGDNIVSGSIGGEQMNPDYVDSIISDSVNATMIKTEILLANKANIEDLSAANAEIENLKANKAEITDLNATNAEIKNLKADKADITDLNATNAEIKNLKADKADITELNAINANIDKLTANKAEITELEAVKADIGSLTAGKADIGMLDSINANIEFLNAGYAKIEDLDANKANIEDLNATNANIENLKADVADIDKLVSNKADITDLNATNANIEKLVAKDAQIENLVSEKADITQLNATNANIGTLTANLAQVETLVAQKANIGDLNATNANIENLKAGQAEIEVLVASKASINDLKATNASIAQLQANKADIGDLTAAVGEITQLKSEVAEIGTLKGEVADIEHILAGNITAENIQTGTITAGSGIIANGAIGNAQISSIDASKISAGKIDTSKVEVAGTDGHLRIKGNRLQVFNGTGSQAKERVSLGDVNGNGSVYGLRVRGVDGTTILLDENGVTSEGITDGSITNDKISDNAEIDGAKLNINSVIMKINEDGSETINGTKIEVEGTNLNTKLSTITTKQTEDSERISQAQSQINANTNAINLKVDEQTYTTDKKDMTSKLEKNTSEITAMKGQIALKVEQTDIENAKSEMEGVIDTKVDSAKAEIKVTTDAISQNVSNLSQTVSTKADGSTVTTLSNKVGSLETSVNGISGKVTNLEKTTTNLGNSVSGVQGEVETLKSDVAELEVTTSGITQKVSNVESTTASLSTQVTTAQNTADSAKSTATTANNTANTAKNTADAAKTQADANKTEISKTNSRVSSIETDLSGITSRVENVEVASVTNFNNLVINSNLAKGKDGWKYIPDSNEFRASVSTSTKLEDRRTIAIGNNNTLPTATYSMDSQKVIVTAGEKLTLSLFALRKVKNKDLKAYILFTDNTSDITVDNSYNQTYATIDFSSLPVDVWTRKEITYTVPTGMTRAFVRLRTVTETRANTSEGDNRGFFSSVMLVRGDKAATWTGNTEDSYYYHESRLNSAESKITEDAITNTVKKNFYTKSETDNQITSKGYQTESEVQQTVNGLEVKVKQSGGYNLLYNGDFRRGTDKWAVTNGFTVSIGNGNYSSPDCRGVCIVGQSGKDGYISQNISSEHFSPVNFNVSGYVYISSSGTDDSSGVAFHYYVRLSYDDGTKTYHRCTWDKTVYNKWHFVELNFSRDTSKTLTEIRVSLAIQNTTRKIYLSQAMLSQGTSYKGWSPNPNEVYDGVTTIDKDGIKVSQSNYNGYTQMKADGFYVNNGSENVISVTSSGATFKGKVTIQSGSSVPTSTLSGTISSNQLNSSITSDINNAKNNASSALSTANTANSNATTALNTANSVNNTLNSNKSNWTNAYNRVNEWAYDAVTGSTTIDGGYLQANTVVANKLAVGDFTNYATVNEYIKESMLPTTFKYGGTAIRQGSNQCISSSSTTKQYLMMCDFTRTTFKLNDEILVEGYVYSHHTETKNIYANIWGYDADKSNVCGASFAISVPPKTWTKVKGTIKLTDSRWGTNSIVYHLVGLNMGTDTTISKDIDIWARGFTFCRKSTGELIVDGAITADKIASRVINADKIVSGTITSNEIKAGTITSDKIASRTITADRIATGVLTANEIKTGTITSDRIASRTITADRIAAGVLTANEIAANTITANKIASRTITADKIAAGAITANEIAAGTITSSQIASGAITTDELAANAVTAAKIAAGTITSDRIASRTITADRIKAGAITANEIKASTITATQMAANSITADKIAAGAITANKIASGAITATMITSGTLDASKVNVTNLNASNITSGTISGNRIKGGTLSATDEINFVGGARIFGNSGSYDAGLFISAQQHELMHGNVYIGENLNVSKGFKVTGATTLNGTVTCNALNSNGQITAKGLSITGNVGVSNQLNAIKLVTNGIDVYGYTNLDGNVHVSGNLGIVGDLTVRNKAIYGMNNIALARGTVYLPQGGGNNTTDYLRIGGGFMACVDSGNFHFLTRNGNATKIYASNVSTSYSLASVTQADNYENRSVFDEINSVNVVDTEEGLRLIDNPIRLLNEEDAQEENVSKAVYTTYNEKTEQEEVNIDYTTAISTLWKAIQELKQENDELKEIIKDIHSKL